jgi:hypothetical protein
MGRPAAGSLAAVEMPDSVAEAAAASASVAAFVEPAGAGMTVELVRK